MSWSLSLPKLPCPLTSISQILTPFHFHVLLTCLKLLLNSITIAEFGCFVFTLYVNILNWCWVHCDLWFTGYNLPHPRPCPHPSLQHVSPPICASSSCLFSVSDGNTSSSHSLSCFCPLPYASCFWHEFITVPWTSGFPVLVAFGKQSKSQSQASPDRTETISEGRWEKTMWPGKRMKKIPIMVSSKILPLWGDPLRNTHTYTTSFLHYLVKGRSLEINVVFSCLLIFLRFGLPWWHSGWETTS